MAAWDSKVRANYEKMWMWMMNERFLALVLVLLMAISGCSDSTSGGGSSTGGEATEGGETGLFPDIGSTGGDTSGGESGKETEGETGDATSEETGEETGDSTSGEESEEAGEETDEETGDEIGPGEMGYPCDENNQCLSGFCVESEDGNVCTSLCLETCPDGWSCQPIQGSEGVYICVSLFASLCKPCNSDEECYSGGANTGSHCISQGAEKGSFCGVSCGGDGDCPEGYGCAESSLGTGEVVSQCQPESGECDCHSGLIASGASTNCHHEDDAGNICTGVRTCGKDGLTDCDADIP